MEDIKFVSTQKITSHGRKETKIKLLARSSGHEALKKLNALAARDSHYLGS
jgi:hypothetical protein